MTHAGQVRMGRGFNRGTRRGLRAHASANGVACRKAAASCSLLTMCTQGGQAREAPLLGPPTPVTPSPAM